MAQELANPDFRIPEYQIRNSSFNAFGFNELDVFIPRPPFTSNFENLLFTQITGGRCVYFERIPIVSTTEAGLLLFPFGTPDENIPSNWLYAQCVLEADATSDAAIKTKARFRQDSIDGWIFTPTEVFGVPQWTLPPSAQITMPDGMPVGDGAVFEIKGRNNVRNFRIKGTEAGKTHYLNVSYFA
jgi:hypothetical protein